MMRVLRVKCIKKRTQRKKKMIEHKADRDVEIKAGPEDRQSDREADRANMNKVENEKYEQS